MATIQKVRVSAGGRVTETTVDRLGNPVSGSIRVEFPLDEARRIASSLNDRRDSKPRRNSESLTMVSNVAKG